MNLVEENVPVLALRRIKRGSSGDIRAYNVLFSWGFPGNEIIGFESLKREEVPKELAVGSIVDFRKFSMTFVRAPANEVTFIAFRKWLEGTSLEWGTIANCAVVLIPVKWSQLKWCSQTISPGNIH